MTKREFDRLTKRNWLGHGMASDERRDYRDSRCKGDDLRPDYLATRAAEYRRKGTADALMSIGFRWRAAAKFARTINRTLLTGRI